MKKEYVKESPPFLVCTFNEENSSLVAHLIRHLKPFQEPSYLNASYLPSFISHGVKLTCQEEAYSSSGNLFEKLEKQYQEERSQCRQS